MNSIRDDILFSKTQEDDYHANEMIKKIKKMKKNKEVPNNYKNIEVLDDIHDSSDYMSDTFVNEGDETFNDATQDHLHGNLQEPLQEGMDPGPYDPADYEGLDEGDKGKAFDIQKYLTNMIEYIYACIYLANYIIAYTIAVILSNNSLNASATAASEFINKDGNSADMQKTVATATSKIQQHMIDDFHSNKPFWYVDTQPNLPDVLLIMKFLTWFESITVSMFAIFNWYYIMFYEEKNAEGNLGRIPVTDFFYGNNMKCAASDVISMFWLPGELWKIINYFLLPSFFFVEHLQFFLKDMLPTALKSLFNQSYCFVTVFVLLIYFMEYCSVFAKNNLIDIINGNQSNSIVKFMYLCTIMVLAMLIIGGENKCNIYKLGEKYSKNNEGGVGGTDFAQLAMSFMSSNFIVTLIKGIFFIFLTTIRCIFVFLVCIPLAGILCLLYVLFYSFFAIFIRNPMNVFGKIQDILNFIREHDNVKKEELRKKPDDFVSNILLVFYEMTDYLYRYCFNIAYLVLFVSMFFIFLNKIKSSSLKITLCTIMGAIALIMITYCIYGVIDLANKYRQMMGLTDITVEDAVKTPTVSPMASDKSTTPASEPFNPFSILDTVSNLATNVMNPGSKDGNDSGNASGIGSLFKSLPIPGSKNGNASGVGSLLSSLPKNPLSFLKKKK